MFTWICPRCGREVPPSYDECPDCTRAGQVPATGAAELAGEEAAVVEPVAASAAGEEPAAAVPPPPPPPARAVASSTEPISLETLDRLGKLKSFMDSGVITREEFDREKAKVLTFTPASAPPEPAPPPPPRRVAPPPPPAKKTELPPPPPPPPVTKAAPPPPPPPVQAESPIFGSFPQPVETKAGQPASPRRGLPTWLLVPVFALAFVGLVAGVYWLVGSQRGSSGGPSAVVENPAAKPGTPPNPYQKFIEVSGVQFIEDAKKKPVVKFVVTNHSPEDVTGLSGNVTIWSRTRKSEEEATGTFQFTTNIGAGESKDLTAPLTTKLEMIELPDWQYISTDVQITAPAQ